MTQPASIDDLLPCPACEYDLRGQPADGRCPECGEPVATAMERKTLHFADRRWLRREMIAFWICAVTPFAAAVTLFATMLVLRTLAFSRTSVYFIAISAMAVDLLAELMMAVGPWLVLSRPRPARFDAAMPARRWGRPVLGGVIFIRLVGAAIMFNEIILVEIRGSSRHLPDSVPQLAAACGGVMLATFFLLFATHIRAMLRLLPPTALTGWSFVPQVLLTIPVLLVTAGLVIAAIDLHAIDVLARRLNNTIILLPLTFLAGGIIGCVLCGLMALRLRRLLKYVETTGAA